MASDDPDRTLIKPETSPGVVSEPAEHAAAPASEPSAAPLDPQATLAIEATSAGSASGADMEATVDLPVTRVSASAEETVAMTVDGPRPAAPADSSAAYEETIAQRTQDLIVDRTDVTFDLASAPVNGVAAGQGLRGGDATLKPGGAGGRGHENVPAPTRYRIMRPHARGGLGEVFVAIDQELQREIALKEIQPRYADHHESRTRFLIEAEVTGGLEHPGIVPVYGLGQYEDGRPYYAMRFIRGDSMRKAIERYYKRYTEADLCERELGLRGLLNRFIDVCEAIHYAHCRGVLHRDLKPDNIMLGDFGETLVVDWGLAKPMGRPEPQGGETLSQLRPMSASSGSVTMLGSAVGTPQFMSPEQAEGRLDELGPASDIYSLGATLYQIVTGAVPFQEKSLHSLLAAVKRGGYRQPREANRHVHPALAAICNKAMALKPEDRYPTAKALAVDVENWLADEPVSVYREPLSMRAMRWARRHRTLVTSTGLGLVLTVCALTVGAVLIKQEQARTEVQRQLAEKNFGQARDAVDQMLTELGEVDLADVPQAEPVRRKMLQKAFTFYQNFLDQRRGDASVQRGTGQAAARLGDILEMLGDYDGAEGAYHEAMTLLEPLAKTESEAKRDLARAHHQLAILLKKSGRFRAAEAEFEEAIEERKALAAAFPNQPSYAKDVTDSLYHFGALLAKLPGRLREVQDSYKTAVAQQRELVKSAKADPESRRRLARYINNLGILVQKTNAAEAEGLFREALKTQEALVAEAPTVTGYQWELARSHSNLAAALIELNRMGQAEREYQVAIDLLKNLADLYPSVPDYRNELAAVRYNLARLQFGMKPLAGDVFEIPSEVRRRDEAVAKGLREATTLLKALTEDYPNRPEFRQRMAMALYREGLFQEQTLKDYASAEASYQVARVILEEIVSKYEQVPEYASALASVLSQSGRMAFEKQGDLDKAIPLLEAAMMQEQMALEGDPQNTFYRLYLRNDLMVSAVVNLRRGDHARVAELADRLAKLYPDDAKTQAAETCRAGRLLVICSVLASKDPKLDPAQRKERQEAYIQRALDHLREAMNLGFRDVKQFDEHDYDAVRNRPDFQRFLKALETKANPILG